MSRHCLYCAKELPKGATNNFCSKDCWTEYKKLKAMDVGTDKQATVLLKRSELADSEFADEYLSSSASAEAATEESTVADSQRSTHEAEVFEDAVPDAPRTGSTKKSPTEITSISDRLTNLEVLLNEKLGQNKENAQGILDDIARKIDDLTIRQSKLEIDLEKVDTFLRSVDKFEDRIRRLERSLQSMSSNENMTKKGFFARLFS
ncbi:hypothetical protein JW823_01485 [bacterium]|nr:hypothetical protein [candidate division CSSED10-310 bacterium]